MGKNSFEADFKELEKIVKKMEEDEVSLEESLKLFEEGVKLSRKCTLTLDKAEKKVEILLVDKNGNLRTAPFEPGDE